jgi:uncharacterized protein YceK
MLVSMAGCGTLMDMPAPCHGPDNPWRVYGGVRNDFEMAQANLADMANASPDVKTAKVVGCAFCALDMPLCAAADTIMLPLTVPFSLARVVESRKAPESPSPAPGKYDAQFITSIVLGADDGLTPGLSSFANPSPDEPTPPR